MCVKSEVYLSSMHDLFSSIFFCETGPRTLIYLHEFNWCTKATNLGQMKPSIHIRSLLLACCSL